MKIALVHDWIGSYAGSEKVVSAISDCFSFDFFALFAFKEACKQGQLPFPTTSFLQRIPCLNLFYRHYLHRYYLPLFPKAIQRFHLQEYDLILSSSHAVAKGVKTNKNQVHICYCHTPMRYIWDLCDVYAKECHYSKGLKQRYATSLIRFLRQWDLSSSQGVDHFIANSQTVAKRIQKIYKRESKVIYPPVDTDFFSLNEQKEGYFVTASRFVPYKKIHLIAEAFQKMPQERLLIIGSGPEKKKIEKVSGKNVTLLPEQSQEDLKKYLQKAKAFLFMAEEDFGIIPVEAMSCGTPVIAYGKGGVTESVLSNETGLFFAEQTKEALCEAITQFHQMKWHPNFIRQRALTFSKHRFYQQYTQFVVSKVPQIIHSNNAPFFQG